MGFAANGETDMDDTNRHARAGLAGALATLALTAIHHVYGAVIYETPWRHHAAFVAAVGSIVLFGAYRLYRRGPATLLGRGALGVLGIGVGLLAVLGFGAYEGFYNHVLKDVLYFGGLPIELHHVMFPPPTYELPNDLLFEVSGVLQVVPAAYAALALYRLVRSLGWNRDPRSTAAQLD